MFWEGFFWLALIITAIITTYAYFKYWAESRILYLWAIFQLLIIIVYYLDNFSPTKGTIQLILLLTAILFLITAKNFKKRKELIRNKKQRKRIRTVLITTIIITIIITITALISANKLEISIKAPTTKPVITTNDGVTIIEMKEPIRVLIKNKGIMPLMINNQPIIICAYTNETENKNTTNKTKNTEDDKNQKQIIPVPEYNNYQMLSTRIRVNNKEYRGKPITIKPHSEKEIRITINKEPVMNQNYKYLLIKIVRPDENNQQYLGCEEIMNNYDQKIALEQKELNNKEKQE